ncbi:uncharacterized protein LOC128223444 [Mya arenaria]|uniref:uncharacterized protein LOC128223444 n=1 Tax=Mya arenaria TaxID=6604 RepID=UPI0022E8AE21|nr:uncharacterized protein LOC128223444 [Mya arenaria]
MYYSKHIRELFVIVLVIESSLCDLHEPRCYSRFDYEEKMLEKMVRTEVKMEELLGKLEALEKRQTNVETEMDTSTKKIQDQVKKHDTEIEMSAKGIQDLEERYKSLQTEFENSTKSYFDGREKSLEVFDQRLDAMSKNISESMQPSPVAFFVIISSRFTTSSYHQTLVFNKPVTDVGGVTTRGQACSPPRSTVYTYSQLLSWLTWPRRIPSPILE